MKLKALGFMPSKADSSLFYYSDRKCTMFVLVYMEDIIVASSAQKFTDRLVKELNQQFTLKDLGDVHYFLSIEVTRMREGLLIDSGKICEGHFAPGKHGEVQGCEHSNGTFEKLLITYGKSLGPKDTTQYRSIIGALQYLNVDMS
jgi:hypothetical protein